MTNIQNILIPTVPITDNIIGTSEYPIPRSAPGNRSIIPHKKYGTVVIDNISTPHLITSSLLVYIISTLSPNIYAPQPNTSDAPTESIAQSISTLSILLNFLTP